MKHILTIVVTLVLVFLLDMEAFSQGRDLVSTLRPVSNSCLHPRDRTGNRCSYYRECLEASIPCETTDFGYAIRYGEKYCNRFEQVRSDMTSAGKTWLDSTMYCLQEAITLWDGRTTTQAYYKLLPAGTKVEAPSLSCKSIRNVEFTTHPQCYLGGPSKFSGVSHASVCTLDWWDTFHIFRAAELQDTFDKEGIEQMLVV